MAAKNADAKYMRNARLARERVAAIFDNRGVRVAAGGETRSARVNRIAREVMSGQRSFDDVRSSVDRLARQQRRGFEPERPDDPEPEDLGRAPEERPRDFFGEARAMFPWLDARLVREFSDAWEETDNVDLAWGRVQQGSTFRKLYGAILRDDGTLRMSPLEYHSVLDGYAQRLAGYGLNPGVFRGKFDELVQGDVSPEEFESRLQAGWEQVASRSGKTRRWYAEKYGLNLSDEALFASFIDPDVGTAVLERRLTNAQIGGAAARFNFERSLARVEQLSGMGVTGETADRFYGQAARDLPGAAARSQRYNRGELTLTDLEEAGLEGDPLEQRRLLRGLDEERSAFSPGRSGVESDEEGRRTGLNAL